MDKVVTPDFWAGKKVFVTGHTGFKGSWLCQLLLLLGAEVTGYGLEPEPDQLLFGLTGLKKNMRSVIGDIRDYSGLASAFMMAKPEVVLHLAAQPIVRDSYSRPRYTYETNVMGTVNILDCIRGTDFTRSFVNVTTDKVYKNNEWLWGYRESDRLDGYDPYSNSKSCSELVTLSYNRSFFSKRELSVSTARAGNVIGGGDFSKDRIIPDCVRAVKNGEQIIVRNPLSIRPYQHVLEPLYIYLLIAQAQFASPHVADSYNIGPSDDDAITTGDLVDLFCMEWGDASWCHQADAESAPRESTVLRLDCTRVKSVFGWKPAWNIEIAVRKAVEWYKKWICQDSVSDVMISQINEYLKESK